MQDPSLRTYRIAFLGSNASGNLPMFTRVQATTGKRAIKAFIERCEPVKGWFRANRKTLPIEEKEEEEGSKPQIGKKQGTFSHAVKIARTVFPASLTTIRSQLYDRFYFFTFRRRCKAPSSFAHSARRYHRT
jgi:hypothetical protein